MPHWPQVGWKLKQSRKCRRLNWLMEVPRFQVEGASSQLLLPPVPQNSMRRVAPELGIHYYTLLNMLKMPDIMFLYKISSVYQLQWQHHAQGLVSPQSHLEGKSSFVGFVHRIVLSGKFAFCIWRLVSTQNTRIWGTEIRREILQNEFNSDKVTDCSAVYANGVGMFLIP